MRRAVVILVAMLLASCGSEPSSGSVTGLVTEATPERVVVRTPEGDEVTFVNRAEDVPVPHLIEHQEQDWPVEVLWERDGGDRVAIEILDAGEAPS